MQKRVTQREREREMIATTDVHTDGSLSIETVYSVHEIFHFFIRKVSKRILNGTTHI